LQNVNDRYTPDYDLGAQVYFKSCADAILSIEVIAEVHETYKQSSKGIPASFEITYLFLLTGWHPIPNRGGVYDS
jgi:hypothetical protein